MEYLLEPLSRAFLVRGLAGGLLVAVACALLSTFVVWRGMSFMGDAIAHTVLPGIVAAYMLGISLFLGALAAAALAVAAIGTASRREKLNEDAAIGVVFAGFFSLGLLALSRIATYSDLSHILFGNILGVGSSDLILMALVTAIVAGGLYFCFKEIVASSFDPAHARAIGLSPELVRYILLSLLAFTTVAAIQTVGVVLVLALLVTPAAAASLVCRRLKTIMGMSVLMAVLATLIGFYVSWYANAASGPAIVLTLTGMFGICAFVGKIQQKSM